MTIFLTLALVITFIASSAMAADSIDRRMRRQADSQYRIAQKAYRAAVKKYGESMTGLPAKEKESACKKMSSALHDNRTQYTGETMMEQMKYKKQIQKLESYNSAFGCQ